MLEGMFLRDHSCCFKKYRLQGFERMVSMRHTQNIYESHLGQEMVVHFSMAVAVAVMISRQLDFRS